MQKMYVLWVFCRSRLLPEVKLCLRKYSLYALRIRYGKRCRPYFRLQSRYCCSRDVAGQASGGMLSGKDRDGRWCGCKQARPAFAAPLRNAAASKGSIVLRHTQSGAMSRTLLLVRSSSDIPTPSRLALPCSREPVLLYLYSWPDNTRHSGTPEGPSRTKPGPPT
jgi:hypothetical protein